MPVSRQRVLRWALASGLAAVAIFLMARPFTASPVEVVDEAALTRSRALAALRSPDPVVVALITAELPSSPDPRLRAALEHRLARHFVPQAVLHGPPCAVVDVAWSADGQRILATSEDGEVRVWRADGRGGPAPRTAVPSPARLTVSPSFPACAGDGSGERFFAFASDGTFTLYDLGACTAVDFVGHAAPVTSAAETPVGRLVLSTSEDGTARIWKSATGDELTVLHGHRGAVLAGAWANDLRVATASADGTVRVWRLGDDWRRQVEELSALPWPEVRQRLAASTSACLTPDERFTLLGELADEAHAGYEACERRADRTPAGRPPGTRSRLKKSEVARKATLVVS